MKKSHPDAITPTKAHCTDAGWDLYAVEDTPVNVFSPTIVKTGIHLDIPKGWCGLIWDRSGLGSKGVHRLAGVIDSGYHGEIKICLCYLDIEDADYHDVSFSEAIERYIIANSHQCVHKVKKGDKIAQILFHPVPMVEMIEEDFEEASERGSKGFGSSGR